MKITELKSILSKREWSWFDVICAPEGIIETKEQYDYVIYYGNHTSISLKDDEKLNSFETAKGKYLVVGNYFGGGSFYFHLDEGKYDPKTGEYKFVPFTYGKYGKIDFEVN